MNSSHLVLFLVTPYLILDTIHRLTIVHCKLWSIFESHTDGWQFKEKNCDLLAWFGSTCPLWSRGQHAWTYIFIPSDNHLHKKNISFLIVSSFRMTPPPYTVYKVKLNDEKENWLNHMLWPSQSLDLSPNTYGRFLSNVLEHYIASSTHQLGEYNLVIVFIPEV